MVGVVFSNSIFKLVTGVTVIVFVKGFGEQGIEIAHSAKQKKVCKFCKPFVGIVGFEPTTSCL